jgi:hypothetical protein
VGNIQFVYRLCADGKHLEPYPGEQVCMLDEIRHLRLDQSTLRGIAAAMNHRRHWTRRDSALANGARGENYKQCILARYVRQLFTI